MWEERDEPEQNTLARFEEVILPHMDAAYNLARWLTRNDHDAEDLVQESYLRAFKFFGSLRLRALILEEITKIFVRDFTNLLDLSELVKQGWCWWHRKYAAADTVLEGLENEAQAAKQGLWADRQPGPPWEWRERSR